MAHVELDLPDRLVVHKPPGWEVDKTAFDNKIRTISHDTCRGCSARLLPLLQRSLPEVAFQTEEGRADATGAADYHLPSGSLMMHVRPTLASYDGSTTFLVPDPRVVSQRIDL